MDADNNARSNIGIIILAAGASTRLGQAKQLLKFEDKTLIFRMTRVGLRSVCFPVQVILGASCFRIRKKIENLPVYIDFNENWQDGMGSSLQFGTKRILQVMPDLEGIVVMVCDQLYVNAQLVNDLVFKFVQTDASIIASSYDGVVGVPALFGKQHFEDLLQLSGDQGAKSILKTCASEYLQTVPFPKGGIDIDTYQDYFLQLQNFSD